MTVVLDPVRYSSAGLELADPQSFSAIRRELLPLATVITPNLWEAADLAGTSTPDTEGGVAEVADALLGRMGAKSTVVITGVRSPARVGDLVRSKARVECVGCPVVSEEKRGTGCRYSSALLCALADGLLVVAAVQQAQALVGAYLRA